ncbi:hypothetical protein ABM34_06475 [Companilactobacillus ginsenosidimutans]|uniref:Uncharacterized protein n=1 Tax=Companilactobacillus ginsenosidimutans TaxID=1007676 RepID=A0A0H4R0G7_9LACO|nr:hypothetical protein ABM34_06475 [Companilactobacillus ginsenosidimutans]
MVGSFFVLIGIGLAKYAVSRAEKYSSAVRDVPSLKCGLETRFEALPKCGKSPNSPGGVRVAWFAALTPLSLPSNISQLLRLVLIKNDKFGQV